MGQNEPAESDAPDGIASEAAVDIRGLSKTFGARLVLNSVDLTIKKGEVHALLGENGSGKSTLIKILAGYHLPDPGGRVAVDDVALPFGLPAASLRAGLRFVHQHLAIVPELNAMENVALEAGYGRGAFIDWKKQARYTEQLLARLQVSMDVRRPLRECRAVERAAVAISRALQDRDRLGVRAIFLDEPTASLPDREVRQLFKIVREVTSLGVAVVYVSHRLEEVLSISDRLSVLRDGVFQGTRAVEGLSHDTVVEMIVGRPVARRHERAAVPRPTRGEPSIFVADGISGQRVRNFDIRLASGEILGVAGIDGSGREDVARLLVGGERVTSGSIQVGEQVIKHPNPRKVRKAGLALTLSNTQSGSAHREFTVRENVTLMALATNRSLSCRKRATERREAARWIDVLSIRPAEPERSYALFSGGNQQKLIFARSLSAEPAVLILDDPTAGVDVGARQAIYELIGKQAESGLGVIVCSSDAEDLISLCHRVLILRQGEIVASLSGAQITEQNLLANATGVLSSNVVLN